MKEAIDKTLESSFLLEDIRQIWRETAPLHKLSDKQRKKAKEVISKIEKNLKRILNNLENENQR